MHYKNGREAKNGDKVVLIQQWDSGDGVKRGSPTIGILYDANPGNDYCNGRIAVIAPNDPQPNLKECLHLDDVLAVLETNDVIDVSKIVTVDVSNQEEAVADFLVGQDD